jgi:hypothetical protein
VIPVVVGSIPISHPKNIGKGRKKAQRDALGFFVGAARGAVPAGFS